MGTRIGGKQERESRPQLAVGMLVAALLAGGLNGYISLPQLIRPTQAASGPVIQPMATLKSEVLPASTMEVDCAQVPCLALTFDDGPHAELTPRVLDLLDRYNAKATFFLIGVHIAGKEALVRRIHEGGHEIGNHTWGHPNLSKLSPAEIEQEVERAQTAITAAGVPAPRVFRGPYGAVDTTVRSHIPLTIVSWNIDPEDWKARKPEQIVEHVLTHAKRGGIVDLHDTYTITIDALDPILATLSQQYHLVTVSDMLNLPPGQQGIYYGR